MEYFIKYARVHECYTCTGALYICVCCVHVGAPPALFMCVRAIRTCGCATLDEEPCGEPLHGISNIQLALKNHGDKLTPEILRASCWGS